MLRRFFRSCLFTIYSVSFVWTLFFLLIEMFPDILTIVQLPDIMYYAQKKHYVSDPHLIFVYRNTDYIERRIFTGDLFTPEYGIKAEVMDYVATYNRLGFRKNSSGPPYDIAVIGDSYIEIGE